MKITLATEQPKWLEAQVAAGSFASIEDALAVAVADLMAVQNDDLAWAKPLCGSGARLSRARRSLVGRGVFQASQS